MFLSNDLIAHYKLRALELAVAAGATDINLISQADFIYNYIVKDSLDSEVERIKKRDEAKALPPQSSP